MSSPVLRIIRIVTASPIHPEKAAYIATRFAEQNGIERYEMKQAVDESLIGGIVIYAGDFRYDYSIKGQLARIAARLKDADPLGNIEPEDDFGQIIRATLEKSLDGFNEPPAAGGQDLLFAGGTQSIPDDERSRQLVVDGLQESLAAMATRFAVDEVGQVLRVSDGIAYVRGLENCLNGELIAFSTRTFGIAMNLEPEQVGVVLLGEIVDVHEGMVCKRTARVMEVPVGKELLGRVVDPLGTPIDGLGAIGTRKRRPIESEAPSIIDRQPVNTPLMTGITAIDGMTPIGRGQRELIIGDRQTGKTAIVIDTILNQRGKGVYCIYVAIGQKMSTIVSVVNILRRYNALEYTTIVVASASMPASFQYIAPFAGCAMAEELMYSEHADVLVVYDDLTKHAQAYRALSLLLRRPPGREAYPGDIFYLHARLLERAARMDDRLGGGSITALPIVETQSGDISAYIPTNVISITDGQIYLESELFFSGQRPAINVGLSVSRVGGSAQTKAMKKVAGPLRIHLAQFRELAAFSQFGSELDEGTQRELRRGERLSEILKQPQYGPIPMEDQVVMLHIANEGGFSSIPVEDIHSFSADFIDHLKVSEPDILDGIAETGLFEAVTAERVNHSLEEYLPQWLVDLHPDIPAEKQD
ncbi:MAG TPA: F0F1 ATP synthase subunit alpha [Clostridia bacterium]